MKASLTAYQLIKEHTPLLLKSGQNSAGIWIIGYRHTFNVEPKQTITSECADAFLKADVSDCEYYLDQLNLDLDQNQYDALISFIFDQGISRLKTSTLLKKIRKNKNDPTIRDEFQRYIYASKSGKSRRSEDLVNLRYQEYRLFKELL
ncbi:MAG: lysozyme [Candidatus Nanoarchaeia archaeon]|nr:lysozyme [Candidatus Nanoarchaeia archaeon]